MTSNENSRNRSPGKRPAPPSAEEAEPHHQAYDIDIYRAWCKQCGLGAAFCTRDCLALNGEGAPMVVKPEHCTGCGWCELHCPDFAISVRECQDKSETEEAD
jgi:2-oxoglutarate ferredoxin oxidoreductase subunit delta